MHKKLEHPNIVRLLNYYVEKERNITYMVLEYADGGSLFEKIKGSQMSKAIIRKNFQQMCEAIQFLHKNAVMHRDIKVNIVLISAIKHFNVQKRRCKVVRLWFRGYPW
jgi:serine/threonine protein kinase